jgi:hypothetical protein
VSGFISLVTPEGAFLLTDGAVYRDDILVGAKQKISLSAAGDFAVTTRGHEVRGDEIAGDLCAYADRHGAKHAIRDLRTLAADYRASDGVRSGWDEVQVFIIAFVPGEGGVHRTFNNFDEGPRPGLGLGPTPAYQVIAPKPKIFIAGGGITADDLRIRNLFQSDAESDEAWFRRVGADLMDIVRCQPARTHTPNGDKWGFGIGCHCDLTSLTAAGGKVERLRTWPDEIGEPIDPARRAA